MYLAKTRLIPFSEEKLIKKTKRYYTPIRYSLKRKLNFESSSYIKNEDLK